MRSSPAVRGRRLDVLVAVCLLLGSTFYLVELPRNFVPDEGYYLYESKRLLDGKVFYRDVFDLIGPGAHYLMAACFRLFGTNIATARAVDAAIHGLIVAVTYAICRTLGVQRAIAAAVSLFEVAFFQPAWQCASPHWLATLLLILLLLVLLRRPGVVPGDEALLAGVITGLLATVQQQNGAVVGMGTAAILAVEYGGALRPLFRFAAGALLIVGPFALLLVGTAGVDPVFQALVLHPIRNYPRVNRVPWGDPGIFPSYTFRYAFAYLPILVVLEGVRAVGERLRNADPERARRSALLVAMLVVALVAIAYRPDFIHIAFIGPCFVVLFADLLAWGLDRAAGRPRVAATWIAAGLLFAGVGAQLRWAMARSHADYPFVYDSPFGRVNFHTKRELDIYQGIRAFVAATRQTELFSYPIGGMPNLLTGTINPTPYQLLYLPYSRPDQVAEALRILEARRVPLVMVLVQMPPGDPVDTYIHQHYVQLGSGRSKLPLFVRKPDSPSS